MHPLARCRRRLAQRVALQRGKRLRGDLVQDEPRRHHLACDFLEVGRLLLRPQQHALDRALVLALQRPHLVELLDQSPFAHRQRLPHLLADALDHRQRLRADDVLLRRHQRVDQRILQLAQAAGGQQPLVVLQLGHQPLLRRHGEDAAAVKAQPLADQGDLPLHLGVDLGGRLQPVPQPVDLVEHRDVLISGAGVANDVAPHVEVALGQPGVGRQHEQHRVRARHQRQGQFGLGADGVQPRRIEKHQPLPEQRMRKIDHRVPPARDLDRAVGIDAGLLVRIVGVEQAVAPRHLGPHADRLGDELERLQHAVGRRRVDREGLPVGLGAAVLGGAAGPRTRLDRQRADARCEPLVVHQLGGTHRRAARRCRQDAPAAVGEEDGVDQLRLAARELGDHGDDQLVLGQPVERHADPARRLGVEQLVVLQPAADLDDRLRQRVTPCPVVLERAGEFGHLSVGLQANESMKPGKPGGSAQADFNLSRPLRRPAAGADQRRWQCGQK